MAWMMLVARVMEPAEDVRLVLEPKSRNVEPEILMESLFRATDLEIRYPLNLNVLDADNTPRVMTLREALKAFLDHRHEVLIRRSEHRLAAIERRLEVLDGFLIAYLNLDEVIRIIREDDDPKATMMRRWKLTDTQVEAILNMRLRALRKLEEIEIKTEHKGLTAERKDLKNLLKDEPRRWKTIAGQIEDLKKEFPPSSPLGRRRTEIADAPEPIEVPIEALVEREPVTVICSEKGWIRTMKGHLTPEALAEVKYKEGDRARFVLPAQSTDKLLLFGTNGRFYTLAIDKLPGGRGHGEPVRLMIDLGNDQELVQVLVHTPGRKLLVAAADGRGFIVPEDDVLAQTRAGKQALNLAEGVEAAVCTPAEGDHVAVLGENRKLIIFPLSELPEMSRGRGVTLQKYKDGGLADAKVFTLADGLSWRSGERTRTETALEPWLGKRAQAGRLPPNGFTRANRFQ